MSHQRSTFVFVPVNDGDSRVLTYKMPGSTYEKVTRFENTNAVSDYICGYEGIKKGSAEINSAYGVGKNNEPGAVVLWNKWLDGPVADFIAKYGTAKVPADIRWAVNDVEVNLGKMQTCFGPDEGSTGRYDPYLHFA